MKWCASCHFYRPPRCSHCSVCDHCVEVRRLTERWESNAIDGGRTFILFASDVCIDGLFENTLLYFGKLNCLFCFFPGLWPSLSLGEQLHRETKLPLLFSVSAVAYLSHGGCFHLWPHLRPAPHEWFVEAAFHCHVSLTLDFTFYFKLQIKYSKMKTTFLIFHYLKCGSDQHIRLVSPPCSGSDWIPLVLSVKRSHHQWTSDWPNSTKVFEYFLDVQNFSVFLHASTGNWQVSRRSKPFYTGLL